MTPTGPQTQIFTNLPPALNYLATLDKVTISQVLHAVEGGADLLYVNLVSTLGEFGFTVEVKEIWGHPLDWGGG